MYSQNDEEKYILEFFGDHIGRFVDIGACDGGFVSNTLALAERGWSGVLVEPSPFAFRGLLARHGGNPRLSLVNVAIGQDVGIVNFKESDTVLGYSTTESANYERWKNVAGLEHSIYVPVLPVSYLLDAFPGPIDFLSIDTEGTSVDVFLSFPLGIVPPRMICVEHDGQVDTCGDFAASYGYRELTRNPENVIYVHD